jgi:hypothetical protein
VSRNLSLVFGAMACLVERAPEGDGYLAALINFRFLAHALWTTKQAVSELTN